LARHPFSGFDFDKEDADVRANVAVADRHADIRASAVMADDNDDDADDGNFDKTLSEILGASSRVSTLLDLNLAFGTVDSNIDPAYIPLFSPLSPLPPNVASPPPSAAAGEPISDPGVFTMIIIFVPYWWLSYNELFSLPRNFSQPRCSQRHSLGEG